MSGVVDRESPAQGPVQESITGGSGLRPASLMWIASYPKSGNTWVRVILASLLQQLPGARFAEGSPLRGGFLCPNVASFDWIEKVTDLPVQEMNPEQQLLARNEACQSLSDGGGMPLPGGQGCLHALKIHDRYDPVHFPAGLSARALYIVRDPRDVAPSWADHLGVDVDGAIRRMGNSRFFLGSREQIRQELGLWSQHVVSWLEAPFDRLWLRYEDMLSDPGWAIGQIAAFAGLPVTEEMIAVTVAASSFSALRSAEEAGGFAERQPVQKRFFRQGRAGAWQETLTAVQAETLWQDHGEIMGRCGYLQDGRVVAPAASLPFALPPAFSLAPSPVRSRPE